MKSFYAVLKRDGLSFARHQSEWRLSACFFVVLGGFFPLALGSEPDRLAWSGAGVIWMAALFSILLAIEPLFRADHQSGVLDHYVLSGASLPELMAAKLLVLWGVTGFPILLATPFLGLCYHLEGAVVGCLMLTLLLGSLALTGIASMAVALTLGLPRAGMLLAILVLPLYAPVLICSTLTVNAMQQGFPVTGYFALLGALCLSVVAVAPMGVAYIVKVMVYE